MRRLVSILCCVLVLWCGLSLCACSTPPVPAEAVYIVMSAPQGMGDPQSNYYRQWLEEKTGLAIHLELVEPSYMPEYLRLLFLSQESGVDAVFFSQEDGISEELLAEYGAAGHILALDSFLGNAPASHLATQFESHTDYDLRAVLSAADGHLYYMPNLNTSTARRNAQTLWMNAAWLQQANMTIPLTTDDFAQVLRAFGKLNAGRGNESGVAVAGSKEDDAQFLLHYLMNAFTYTDPYNAYFAARGGDVYFAPATGEWRQGLLYCRALYQEGLLPELCFTFSSAQFERLVNDPRDLVGAFTAGSIGEVLSAASPALSSRYIHIPPLRGPNGVQYATVRTVLPTPGGVITANCQNPQAVFSLMDTMLGEEAYLVAAFGRQGVDWDFAGVGDIGYDGEAAVITVKSPEWDMAPNRNFSGAGPFFTSLHYADGVAWNGYQADQRYMDARAARVYQAYIPDTYIRTLRLTEAEWTAADAIKAFVWRQMVAFITTEQDPANEDAWQQYLRELNRLGLEKLLDAIRASYQPHGGEGQ